jgi:hypothetical protein
MTGARRAKGRRKVATIASVALVLLGCFAASAMAGGSRRTYIAARPGVIVKVTATPYRVTAVRVKAQLRCAGGSHRNLSLGFGSVSGTPLHDGAFVFHHGHANSVTILRGRVEGSRIKGKFRYETRLTPANVRCGTIAPTGDWVTFVARAGR